jgi:carnitine O-palmitoyltransferase 2
VGGGFGPVSPGYGIGYAAGDDMTFFTISNWKSGGPNHSARDFAAALYQSMHDMEQLLLTQKTE